MNLNEKNNLRQLIKRLLQENGDAGEIADGESIFISGRLSSFYMMMLVVELEKSFGIDFSKVEFVVDLFDTINDIETFLDTEG